MEGVVGFGKLQSRLLTALAVVILIRLAWWSLEPLLLPIGVALIVGFLLVMVYRFVFRG
jgi:hypothetical protein